MSIQCKINIKPNITIGRVPTIVEGIIPNLFDEKIVLQSESIVNDKKKFFKLRLDISKFLIPIVENIISNKKEATLVIQLFDSGKLKIFQLKHPSAVIPDTEDDEDDPYKL